MPTVPTADEVLDRSFRRAAKKMKEKDNKEKANEEFVRAVSAAVHDKMVAIIQGFPEFDELPPFYRELADILYGIDNIKKALGAVGWAAKHTKMVGNQLAVQSRKAEDTTAVRKRAVARLASMVHQIDKDLRFLNEIRNVLRKLPHVEDAFTTVIAGYPNVGKSSFIRRVSSAEPQVASYPFTTKGIIVGHNQMGRERIQFVDTPGILLRKEPFRYEPEEDKIDDDGDNGHKEHDAGMTKRPGEGCLVQGMQPVEKPLARPVERAVLSLPFGFEDCGAHHGGSG